MKVACYISGHGFGHATRAYIIIKSLLQRGHSITIITFAPKFIFQDLILDFGAEYRSSPVLDSGVIQKDAYTIDIPKTINSLSSFLDSSDLNLKTEVDWLKTGRFDLVYLDAPFLPALCAKKAGLPSVIVSNFTFDAIYKEILTDQKYSFLLDQVFDMYKRVDHLIRLPGYIDIPGFQGRDSSILDVSLVVRKSLNSREIVRKNLGLPLESKIVLITFGGFDLNGTNFETWTNERLPSGWYGIVACPNSVNLSSDRLVFLKSEDHFLPDLINSADVILGKCGYGTCSEVVAHFKPLVYVPRKLFAEEAGLLGKLMRPYGRSIELPISDFKEGKWASYIEAADSLPPPKEFIQTNGNEQVCEALEKLINKY